MSELRAALDALPLPEPFDYCYEWDGPYGTRKFSVAAHNGRRPDRSVQIHRDDAIRAAHRDGARLALELAVAVCEAVWRQQYSTAETPEGGVAIQSCQFALRAQLKEFDQ